MADQPSSRERLAVGGWGSRLDPESLLRGEFQIALGQMHGLEKKKQSVESATLGLERSSSIFFTICETWLSQENSASCECRILNTFSSKSINYTIISSNSQAWLSPTIAIVDPICRDKTGVRQRKLGQLWSCGQFETRWSPEVLCGLLIVCWKGGLWKRLCIFYIGDWWSLRWAWRSSCLRSSGPKTTLHGWGTFHMRATVTENAISSGNEGQIWNSYLTNVPLGHCDAGPISLFKQKPS